MLMTVDVGNTNITFGVIEGENIIATFRMTTKIQRTSDEFGIAIRELLSTRNIDYKKIQDVIISSVVPDIMHSFVNSFIKYFDKKPIVVGPGVKTGIKLPVPNPAEIGADRVVDAVGAYYQYGGPVIVIDFGTATTYDYISSSAEFLAGITSPGIKICAKALWQDTAKLPEIEIKKPDSIMAKETISSMQAGLVYGYIGQTEYIVNKIKEECGESNVKVVATGGLGKLIADETDCIDVYDKDLTLSGLRLIYEKTKRVK